MNLLKFKCGDKQASIIQYGAALARLTNIPDIIGNDIRQHPLGIHL